jgi:hypothetical protein
MAVLAAGLLPALASAAAAAPRSARLSYSRGAGASGCPDAEVIRAGVAARLGYQPFDERAELLVSATVSQVARGLEARIQITGGGAPGSAAAERRLVSRQSDCQELAAAMELAISIAIDPLAASRARAEPGGATASAAPPALPPAPPQSPPPPAPAPAVIVLREQAPPPAAPDRALPPPSPATPLGFRVRLGGLGALGSAPAAALGGTVQASVRRGPFSLGLEGRGDMAASAELRVGTMETSLLMGSLVPCLQRGILEGCVLLSAGAVRAAGRDLVDPRHVSAPFVAFGARMGVELPMGSVLAAGAHVDVLAPITELVLRVDGQAVWTSPPISGALGLTIGARFP